MSSPEELIKAGDTSPDTPRKRRTTWWNKNQPYLMGMLALVLVIGVVLSTTILKTAPDYIVGLVTSYSMPEAGRRQLEELLTLYADDRNGDGRVMVKLQAYAFVPDTTDIAQRDEALLDLQATLITNDCMIFLSDEVALAEIAGELDGVLQYNDGTPMPEGARDFENAGISWKECRGLSSFEPDPDRLQMWDPEIYLALCENLRVNLRAENEIIARDPEYASYHESSVAYAARLVSGEKVY